MRTRTGRHHATGQHRLFRQQVQFHRSPPAERQRLQLERRFASSGDQLEDLYDKFDFSGYPPALNMILSFSPRRRSTGNHPFYAIRRLDHAEVDVATEDEGRSMARSSLA